MPINKGGRRPLGNKKRQHRIMLRFNDNELEQLKRTLDSYSLDYEKRGVMGPFLRRMLLNKEALDEKKLPDMTANLIYQINKIGTNINQLITVARSKNLRNPSAKLETEIEKSNLLLEEIFELLNKELL